MPHSEASTRNEAGYPVCGYCGRPLKGVEVTCGYHSDLPALEPLDDRYTLREDTKP